MERPLDELRADGGASRNDRLLQLQANLIGCPVVRSDPSDAAAVGAALLAAHAVGLREGDVPTPTGETFEPQIDAGRREELLARWHEAVGVEPVREAALR